MMINPRLATYTGFFSVRVGEGKGSSTIMATLQGRFYKAQKQPWSDHEITDEKRVYILPGATKKGVANRCTYIVLHGENGG